jgi:hypothetical protein
VHGYEHGHRLLAGTPVPLSREEQDLITRLSDLSGGMVPGETLVPYVTAYPLPSKTYYAIAKTWPDREAPRAGCVLTHTILVPMELWMSTADVAGLGALLRFPQRNSTLEPLQRSDVMRAEPTDDSGLDDFIAKFFGEGIRPLVWFGAQTAEATTWRLLSALWPALRSEFSCCTLSLQPRTLDDRPFDLMFAPLAARSRFAEYLGTHEVAVSREAKVEEWAAEWKAQIFGGMANVDSSIAGLCSGLDATPNAIRKVYLFIDLYERAKTAPLAAIGALDVLQSLGPLGSRVSARISDLVRRAVDGTASAPAAWALEVFCLVGLRIDRIDSALIEPQVDEVLAQNVREYVAREPIAAVELAERFSTRDLGKLPRSFVHGLSEALAANVNKETLSALASATHVGLNILQVLPDAAAKLIRAGRTFGAPLGDVLASWYAQIKDVATRQALRQVLMQEIEQADEAPLLADLLRDLSAPELQGLLAGLESHGVAPELGRLYMELVGERFANDVIVWASTQRTKRATVAGYVVAGAVPLAPDGIHDAESLDESGFVLAAVIDRALRKAPPQLLRDAAMRPTFWECLLSGFDDDFVAAVLVRIVGVLNRSAIGRAQNAHVAIGRAPVAVQVHAVREVLLDHLFGLATSDDLNRWLGMGWASSTLSRDASLLRSVIADGLSTEHFNQAWLGAWRTLGIVSSSVSDTGGAILEICGLLLWRRATPWPSEVADIWRGLLKTSAHSSLRHQAACAQALRFCFDNRRLPLGPVVAEAFFTVHAAAMRDEDKPSWDFFGWANWDKGGELRRRLVDSFFHGEWEPEAFVLAAGEPWLLRKLCKRMLRQWRGLAFLERAFDQLRAHPPSPLAHELADILRDPEYVVDWD